MTIRVIDIETTGVDPAKDKMVEIASVDLTEDGGFNNPIECLVNPGIPIPPEVSAIHHIIDEDVKDALSQDEAIKKFSGADIYVAHNSRFENKFLPATWRWLCTYKAALRIWPEAPGHSNQVLRYWLGLHDIPGFDRATMVAHRALPDAATTAMILHRLLRSASLQEMAEWTQHPALLPKFRFGKHADEPMSEVPASYLEWIIGKSDFDDEDILHTARIELNRRRDGAT